MTVAARRIVMFVFIAMAVLLALTALGRLMDVWLGKRGPTLWA